MRRSEGPIARAWCPLSMGADGSVINGAVSRSQRREPCKPSPGRQQISEIGNPDPEEESWLRGWGRSKVLEISGCRIFLGRWDLRLLPSVSCPLGIRSS